MSETTSRASQELERARDALAFAERRMKRADDELEEAYKVLEAAEAAVEAILARPR